MPSSNKTSVLNLNKWLGTDKPKKDDFNGDNQRIDDAFGGVSSLVGELNQVFTEHMESGGAHVTEQEKTAWSAKDKFIVGTYQGNGAASRKIDLGFRPRLGLVYAAGAPMVRVDFDAFNCNVNSAYFSSGGSGDGVATDATGFTVTHHTSARPGGLTLKLNDSAFTYVYIAWP